MSMCQIKLLLKNKSLLFDADKLPSKREVYYLSANKFSAYLHKYFYACTLNYKHVLLIFTLEN